MLLREAVKDEGLNCLDNQEQVQLLLNVSLNILLNNDVTV